MLATVEDITDKRIALENLTTAHAALQRLTPHLLSAQEQERQRIARELHDDIGQRLSLLTMDLDVLKSEIPVGRTNEQQKIHDLLGQLDELVSDVHNMSHQLHSSKLKHLGLAVALKEVCRRVAGQNKVVVDLIADGIPQSLPDPIALCFYRVAQEALTNAVRHSGSQRIQVKLSSSGNRLRMLVKDAGCGFDLAAHGSGLGLVTMYERIRMIGGKLRIDSTPGGGTELLAEAEIQNCNGSSEDAA